MSQYDWKQPFGYETTQEQNWRAEEFERAGKYMRNKNSGGGGSGCVYIFFIIVFAISYLFAEGKELIAGFF